MTDKLPTVVQWRQTCMACPSQWEGRLDDGRFFYGRYRWGYLSLGFGDVLDAAVMNGNSWGEKVSGDFDGDMPTHEFRQRTAHLMHWDAALPEGSP